MGPRPLLILSGFPGSAQAADRKCRSVIVQRHLAHTLTVLKTSKTMVRAPRPPASNALAPLRTRGQRLPRVPGPPAARKPAQIPTVSLSRADSRRALDAEEARWADALGVWWRAERQSRQGQGWRAEEYASPATHSRPQYSEPPADIGPVLPAEPVTRSARAGLQFPVGRIHRFLKNSVTAKGRVGATAAVYSAAILERVPLWRR